MPVNQAHAEGPPALDALVAEALENNHEIIAASAGIESSYYRITRSEALSDPMVMLGYQNESFDKITYGEMADSQWMFSVSQMFPFPGKRSIKGEMASKDHETLKMEYEAMRRKVVFKVKELYYDLFLAQKGIEILESQGALLRRIEDASIAGYSTGMASQQDVLMVQAEKYMTLERQEMLKQKAKASKAILISTIGKEPETSLENPEGPKRTEMNLSRNDLYAMLDNSPEVKARQKMIESSEAGIKMAKREYYPDLTFTGSVATRGGVMDDMWSLTGTINIPVFYRSNQRMALKEAVSEKQRADHDLAGVKFMLRAELDESLSMAEASDRLIELYKDALIPKAKQGFESSISSYIAGKADLMTVLKNLTALREYELSYWRQFVEREKAAAKIVSLAGE